MHKILQRQLRRLQASLEAAPSLSIWKEFLAQVDRAYLQGDQDRYLLERSLAISSKEMQDVYKEERRLAQEALMVSEGRYRSLFENAVDCIFIVDVETRRILDANQVASEKLGYSREEFLGMSIDELNLPAEMKGDHLVLDHVNKYGSVVFERTHVTKDGSTIPFEVSTKILEFEGRKIYQSFNRDITERKIAEQALKRMATHDGLTGLANRTLFEDRLRHAIQLGKRNNRILAVLFLDLDGFKAVNDAFGHKQGDRLLQTISQRIESTVRQSDTVARFGGDEFAILLESISAQTEVIPIAQKLISAVAAPFVVQNAEAFITCSIGISLFPEDGDDADTLLQNADRAMYLGKAEERNSYRFFKPAMKTQALERLELGNQLRQSIERREFSMVYQPQIDSRTGQVVGIEALSRWHHPEQGMLPPELFIPLAEETGLIAALSDWVLETACVEIKALFDAGAPQTCLAVNLSHRDLNQPNLGTKVRQVLARTGFPAPLLELELSENTIFRDMDKSREVLEQLKALGVRLAIDDFGVGYSTLSQLARLPFDTLKIDRQFATHLSTSPNDVAVVTGIIAIAKSLGVDVVAEGVETQAQLDFYEALGCHRIQGWLFAEAVPASEIPRLLTHGVQREPVDAKR